MKSFREYKQENLFKKPLFCEVWKRNKGLQGVYSLGSWRLIECLEDKLSDIRYPSG